MARVLVFTPTYNDLLQPETVASIDALEFDGELQWELSDENPYPGRDMRNCVHQFRKGRQIAIEGGYDALMLIEHDMIVPKNTVQRLWDTPAQVVYGTYMLRHGMHCVNLFQYVNDRATGMSLSIYPRELQMARQQGWIRVSGAGFGCLMIKRPVFAHVPFRDVGNAPDLPFAEDCIMRKIECIGRADVICGHIDTLTGETLWPFEEGVYGMVARVLALQDVVTQDGDTTVVMRAGSYYSVGVAKAKDLARAGFVRITNAADAVVDEENARETAVNEDAERRETAVAPKVRRRRRGAGVS